MYNLVSFIKSFFNLTIIRKKRVLILAYHNIENCNSVGNDLYTVTKRNFAMQMKIVKTFFKSISPNELLLKNNSTKHRILITFDDGKKNNITNAFPILHRLGLKALFFIPSDFIGTEGYMTSDDLKYLSSHNMYIGSHSNTHPDFGAISINKTKNELKISKNKLEKILNKKINSFAYPYGNAFNTKENDIPLLQKVGFEQAFVFGKYNTYKINNPYRIPRLMVTDVLGITFFNQLITTIKNM